MFRIICKSIHSFATTSKPHKFSIQQFSTSHTNSQHSFTVGYLINEFGYSLEKAVSASKSLHFKNADKPDVVVSFLKHQGFTHTQIQKLILYYSRFLSCRPETTLLPKIDFFRSKGVSSTDLAKMIVLNPILLRRSLEQYIIPAFNSLTDLLGSDQAVILLLKSESRLLTCVENRVKPNIEILHAAGLPNSSIASLLRNSRIRLFCFSPDTLNESIEQVQKLGMDPLSCSYREALYVLTVTSRSKLNEKMEAYKRWGCSEDEVLTTFKIEPHIMAMSVDKINRVMSFCVNEMGWEPSEVVRTYSILKFSLNKRIIPRWSVYQELLSKSLVKIKGKLSSMFVMREDLFLKKYVNCYRNEAPQLSKLYHEKLEAAT